MKETAAHQVVKEDLILKKKHNIHRHQDRKYNLDRNHFFYVIKNCIKKTPRECSPMPIYKRGNYRAHGTLELPCIILSTTSKKVKFVPP